MPSSRATSRSAAVALTALALVTAACERSIATAPLRESAPPLASVSPSCANPDASRFMVGQTTNTYTFVLWNDTCQNLLITEVDGFFGTSTNWGSVASGTPVLLQAKGGGTRSFCVRPIGSDATLQRCYQGPDVPPNTFALIPIYHYAGPAHLWIERYSPADKKWIKVYVGPRPRTRSEVAGVRG